MRSVTNESETVAAAVFNSWTQAWEKLSYPTAKALCPVPSLSVTSLPFHLSPQKQGHSCTSQTKTENILSCSGVDLGFAKSQQL